MKRFTGQGSTLPITQIAVLDLAERQPVITPAMLVAEFGLSRHRASHVLRQMACASRLRCVKRGVFERVQ